VAFENVLAAQHDREAQREGVVVRGIRQSDQGTGTVYATVQGVRQRLAGAVAVVRDQLLHGRVQRIFLRRQ